MNIFAIISIITILLLLILLFFEFKRDIMMFQQNSYRSERYIRWVRKSGDSTSFSRLTAIFLLIFSMTKFGAGLPALVLISVLCLFVTIKEAGKKYKKPLVFTKRVKRLVAVNWLLTVCFTGLMLLLNVLGIFETAVSPLYISALSLLLIYFLSHQVVITSNFLLQPLENQINRGYYHQAKAKLESMPNLIVIGITGSYGKTSTKHYLYDLLSRHFDTLMTPGSFNTTLGVVRTINESLKPYHRIFIVEMGAKQKGDIAEICNLVRPHIGIITSVGPQHLETFGTIENVRDTKFELADALPADGYAFVNADYDIIANREITNCNVVRYGLKETLLHYDVFADNIEYDARGTEFTFNYRGQWSQQLATSLMGSHNITNLTGALAVAVQLGVDRKSLIYSVENIHPIEHRLSLRPLANGATILDDAFNSNPKGAAMAVDVLSKMNPSRSIVITPGMIELGDRQYSLNREFGKQMAQADISFVALVGLYNREALSDGLREEHYDEGRILFFDTFLDANAWMINFVKAGDVILIENDLPDTFK